MLPRSIERFLQLCDWCGLSTQYTHRAGDSTNQNRRTICLFIMNIVISIFVSASMCYFMSNPLREFGPAGLVNDATKYACMCAVYMSATIEALSKRREKRELWQLYKHLRTAYPSHSGRQRTLDRFSSRMIWFFTAYASQQLASMMPVFTFHGRFLECFWIWACDCLVFLVHQLRIFHYLFHVNLLSDELHALDASLNEIVRDFVDTHLELRPMSVELPVARRRYALMRKLVDHLNEIFGWSQVTSILSCFVGVTCGFNYFYQFWEDILLHDCFGETCSKFAARSDF